MLRSSGAIDVRSSHGNKELTWHQTWIVLDIKDYFASSFVLDHGKTLGSCDHKMTITYYDIIFFIQFLLAYFHFEKSIPLMLLFMLI